MAADTEGTPIELEGKWVLVPGHIWAENEKLRAALQKIVVRHKLHPFNPDSVIAQKALNGGDDDD